jgi:hypothetical protein
VYAIVVPAIRLYHPPIELASVTAAVRRAKQIASAYPSTTVDIFRNGRPVFALGASQFGGSSGLIPSRSWAEFQRINGLSD